MATTVQAGFSVLLSRQHLADIQKATADTRIVGLKKSFANNFAMAAGGVFLAGSYGRGTICRGQRDIDLIAPLSYPTYKATYDNDPKGFLYFVRKRLNERYYATKVSSKRVAVTLDFTGISVDIVPCFPRFGDGYLMPNGKGDWMPTNPKFHNTFFAKVNGTHGNDFKPLVRLIKAWNLANGKHLRSFHIEVILERMWDGKAIDSDAWPKVVASTLNAMGSYVRNKKYDPWDSSIRVDDYLSSDERSLVIRLLNADAERAKTAEQYRKGGKTEKAFERWGVVYNHKFPSYG